MALIEEHGLERVGDTIPPFHAYFPESLFQGLHIRFSHALYVTATGRWVVILRAFVKKTRKTPRKEINLALKRAEIVT